MSGSTGQRYSPEFRSQAVQIVRSSGKKRSQVAHDLGVSVESLRRWELLYDPHGNRCPPTNAKELAKIARLKRELGIARGECDLLERINSHLRPDEKQKPADLFKLVRQEEATGTNIKAMCRLLGVSRSGYYKWLSRKPSAREQSDAALRQVVEEIHEMSGGTFGAPRVHAELRFGRGIRCAKKRVARLMREMGLKGAPGSRRTSHAKRNPETTSLPDCVDGTLAV